MLSVTSQILHVVLVPVEEKVPAHGGHHGTHGIGVAIVHQFLPQLIMAPVVFLPFAIWIDCFVMHVEGVRLVVPASNSLEVLVLVHVLEELAMLAAYGVVSLLGIPVQIWSDEFALLDAHPHVMDDGH